MRTEALPVCLYATFGIGNWSSPRLLGRGGARDEAAISTARAQQNPWSSARCFGRDGLGDVRSLGPRLHDHRDVSISHFEELSIGVIAGGASVAGGIILLANAV
jgi:hypothetical protein